jgi:hypothetical protein
MCASRDLFSFSALPTPTGVTLPLQRWCLLYTPLYGGKCTLFGDAIVWRFPHSFRSAAIGYLADIRNRWLTARMPQI